jgi:putative toxin-antitoxin system antitoxin component (TIGR02293 family)
MSARSRKKGLYRRLFGRSDSDQLHTGSTKTYRIESWLAIKPDAMRVFGKNSAMAWEWFITPAIALDNKRPIDLVVAGNLQIVRDHLIRLEHGVYT